MTPLNEATAFTAVPFVASAVSIWLSLHIGAHVRQHVERILESANTGRGFNVKPLPVHLRVSSIGGYVEYAADAAQAMPAGFLFLLGLATTISLRAEGLVMVGLLLLFMAVVGCWLRLLKAEPLAYVSKRYLGFTFVNFALLVLNVTAISSVVLARLLRPQLLL